MVFCALVESFISYLHLINTNKLFGVVAEEAIGVKILIMILMSANLVYY